MTAAGYLRVSTEDQGGERYSLDNQRDAITLLAAREGLSVSAWYEDSKAYKTDAGQLVEPSARRTDRPAWRRMLADADAGRLSAILALDHTRLYGDYEPAAAFIACVERNKLKVLLTAETFDTEFSMFHGWARRQWYRQHAARTRAGMISRVKSGLGSTSVPIFYKPVRDKRGKSIRYELLAEYQPWLDRLAALFLEGISYERIGIALGPHPITGGPLNASSVKNIITKPFMRGLVSFETDTERVTARGLHAAAWDDETCAEIEREIDRRAATGFSVRHHMGTPFLFTGILRCGVCGYLMVGHTSNPRQTSRQRYAGYQCGHGRAARLGLATGSGHTNNIGEIKLVGLLRAALAAITPEKIDAFLPYVGLPRHSPPSLGELDDLSRQAAELRADLDAVKSPTARKSIAADLDRALRRITELSAAPPPPSPDMAATRAALIALTADPSWLDWPRERLRPVLLRAFPALYVAGGQFAPPVTRG